MKTILKPDQFKARLRAKGLRATSQRIAVHKAMTSLVHASAEDVCRVISESGDSAVTTASVYNILSQMASIGIYRRRLGAGGKMCFDADASSSLHLYDIVGDEYRDLQDQELLDMVEAHFKGKRFRGYKMEGIDIQIICHPSGKRNKRL